LRKQAELLTFPKRRKKGSRRGNFDYDRRVYSGQDPSEKESHGGGKKKEKTSVRRGLWSRAERKCEKASDLFGLLD